MNGPSPESNNLPSGDPWGPPNADHRFDSNPRSASPAPRKRHRGLLAAGVVGGVLAVGGGSAVITSSLTSQTSASPVVTGGATPSTIAPTGAAGTASRTDLTAGIVNIDTDLAYQAAQAAGTGMILTSDGRILTNNHVIDGATTIKVTVLTTGATYTASVVGTDPTADVAVLQLANAKGLTVAPLGNSDTVKVGDSVVALGNALGKGTPTTAPGAVTDLGQTITASDQGGGNAETLNNLIQISSSLQPGESGGPLYNAAGKVIGMDSAGSGGSGTAGRRQRTTTPAGSSQGFAIPINDALAVAKQIEAGKPTGAITIGTPPMLGIAATPTTTGTGVLVTGVANGTPAAAIGLAAGDSITEIGTTPVTSQASLADGLHSHKAGDKIAVTWTDANGAVHHATATLIAGPAN